MIQPTVGRVVHYFRDRDSEAQVALIAKVNDDDTVNLAVFDHNGTPEPRPAGITLVQDGEIAPLQGHYCAWMAYQLGQAAKTEAVLTASQTGLRSGETSFQNETTGFGGVFAGTQVPVLTEVVDTPVPVKLMEGGGGTFDGGGASGDWVIEAKPGPDSAPAQQDEATRSQDTQTGSAAPSYDTSPSSTESSSYTSSDSSSSSSYSSDSGSSSSSSSSDY